MREIRVCRVAHRSVSRGLPLAPEAVLDSHLWWRVARHRVGYVRSGGHDMLPPSKSLTRVNAILLLLLAPIVVRFWVEAVIWRLERGPQMLGFSLAHGGAGWMTLPLILSFLTIWIYAVWVVIVIVLWAIPQSRGKIAKPHRVVLGGVSLFAFLAIADFLQADMSTAIVLLGAAAMSTLACAIGWLIYAGFCPTGGNPWPLERR